MIKQLSRKGELLEIDGDEIKESWIPDDVLLVDRELYKKSYISGDSIGMTIFGDIQVKMSTTRQGGWCCGRSHVISPGLHR